MGALLVMLPLVEILRFGINGTIAVQLFLMSLTLLHIECASYRQQAQALQAVNLCSDDILHFLASHRTTTILLQLQMLCGHCTGQPSLPGTFI